MSNALVSECIDLDERLGVIVDTETYASTVIEIRAKDGETLKQIEVIGGQEGQDTIVDGEMIDQWKTKPKLLLLLLSEIWLKEK